MSLLRRALVGATVVVAALAVTAPAEAAPASATCQHATSTRLLTANNGDYKIWVERITSPYTGDAYHICWKSSNVSGGDIVVKSPFQGTPVPTVTYVVNDPTCPDFFTIQDPVQLVTELRTQLYNPYGLCLGVGDGRAIKVNVGVPYVGIPDVDLFLDKYTTLTNQFCSTAGTLYYSQCYYSWYESVQVI